MKRHLQAQTQLQAGRRVGGCNPFVHEEYRDHPDFWRNITHYQARTCYDWCTDGTNAWMRNCAEWTDRQRGFLGFGGE